MEDLIFIKPGNKVKIEYRRNKYPLELYVLYVGTELLQSLSDENTRLDEAFDIVPFQVKTVHSESESAMLIKNISKKLFWMRDGGKPQVWNIAVWGVSLLCKDMRFFICKRIIDAAELSLNPNLTLSEEFYYFPIPDNELLIVPGLKD